MKWVLIGNGYFALIGNGYLEPGMEVLGQPFTMDDLARKAD